MAKNDVTSNHATFSQDVAEAVKQPLAITDAMLGVPAIDLAWEAVNALGGTADGSAASHAYVKAIEDALAAIENLGGKDPAPALMIARRLATVHG